MRSEYSIGALCEPYVARRPKSSMGVHADNAVRAARLEIRTRCHCESLNSMMEVTVVYVLISQGPGL